ncbi:hypothetical protein [Pseudosulfitobacter pseudonitzschiae]|uniref:hypothetical protein n=1 Tax=Pseudosulfitobacter pseudonitzschiae TaxID=1402135 RepID=UPI001AF3F923|nr:hypothetical protein [Pseudosulfitobacter pseudonitzschiae]MBM1816261.1 hypothetical protein [Pseudosulfitobacter pseudonitzschiae]MBM1833774.1 hypothetical protein [Pseudosulfitobacter pseudonitzschiae]MBM1838640.1 hypothetical protein [Pseudosulfitobacter pseudonitzschiae]MBM1842988.1 hypothetical protein [Pseudosulfitobacter pseudonitzschiae]MBM1847854.1 hypothetical protein [Pseudosulfitobacter pseudonitzschiae]
MNIQDIVSVSETATVDVKLVIMTADIDGDGVFEEVRYGLIEGDTHGAASQVRQAVDDWIADGGAVAAYEVVAATEADIRAEGARRLRLIAAAYTAEERETWATQVDEANALAADPEADVPMIEALAAADGVTVAQMAGFIMANKNAFTAASAAILAAQRTLIAMDPRPTDYTDNTHWT